MKKKLLLFFTFFCVFGLHQNIKGQTLGAGDIAFIGFDIGGQDGFSFIALKTLPAGEIVYFTEEGLSASGWIGSNEPHIRWTIPAGVTCGKIISVIETGTNVFTVTGGQATDFVINPDGATYSFNLSAGDQMLAYQSTGNAVRPAISPTTITFLAGVHGDFNSLNNDPVTHWNNPSVTGGLGGAESIIPPGLTNGVNCIALFPGPTEVSQFFAKYTGTLTGTSATLRTSINTQANWTFTSASAVPPETTQGILPSNYTTPNITCTTAPTVTTTTPVTIFGAVTATLGGSNDNGNDSGTINRGIVWSLTTNPVINDPGVTQVTGTAGTGTFTIPVNSLPAGSVIYYRAYAQNSVGTSYGNTVSFTTNAALSATQSQTVACNGTNNGTATVTPSGGKAPYTYAWSHGPTTATVTGLAANTNYSVLITDNEGTSISKNFTIVENSAIQGGITVTNVSCNGGNNGAIDLTPSGGSGTYTYNWGGGVTTQDRVTLAAGTYSVTITDSNNCSVTISNIVVGQPTAALNGTTNVTTVACNGGNTGAIDLTPSGGTGAYTFLWNDGVTTEDRAGIPVGSYSVTITDANSCTRTITGILVTQPASISTSATLTHLACFGGNTGSIVLSPTGGVPGYTYLWSDGVTTQNRTGLTAGTYNVTITDSNNCSRPFSFTLNQPNFALGGTVTVGNASCNGGSNGSIDLTPSGGTPGYTYNWSDGPTTQDRIGLTAGTYSVTIRDANNCSFVISNIVVGQPTTALSALTGGGQTDVSCNGGGNGTATVAPTGGTPSYTYSWDTTPVQTTATATGLSAGTYTVTVTDANGCQTTRSYTIGQPAAALSALTGGGKTDVSCRGDNSGSATVAPTGGTPGYTYSWAPSGGTSATATGLAAGVYTVTVTDANGCQAFRTFTIGQPASVLNALTGGGKTDVSCNGGGNGTATVAPTGGTPSYTYSWDTTPVQTTATATGLSAGTYTVTVTDANGCQATRSYTIGQPAAPLTALTGGSQTDVSCNGGANGTATVAPTGGTPSYTYSWNTSPVQTTATATGLSAGVYTVTITDANSCQATRSFTIGQPAILSATKSKTDVLCKGSATGSATVTPNGGNGGYTYVWSPSGGTAATATGLATGNYSCLITDANGCSITETFFIDEPSAITASTSYTNATCSTGGDATVFPNGGVGGYSYLWTPGNATTQTINNLAAGNYTCLITDANGCTISKAFTITTTNTLVAATSQTDLLCNGENTGSASVLPSGAVGPFTYVWSPSGGTADTANNLAAGNYSVTITAGNGCSIVKNFTINEPPAIVLTKAGQTEVTCNSGSNGTATVAVTGGTGAYTYSWAPFGGTSASATGLSAGTYTVTVTDANLCTKTESFTITQPDAITATTTKTDVSCNGGANGSATVSVTGGTGAYTYSWAPAGGTAATATGLAAGTYTVTITDANFCQTTETVTIDEPTILTASITKTDVSCNQANNGTATVTAAGGTGTYIYSWSPSGGTAATATGLSPDTYTVTVTDANGCFITETIQITEPAALSASDSQTNVSCKDGNDGTATVTASGGTGAYTYSWAPAGGTAATATGLSAGTYTVTVTDANSCSITNTITITEPDALALTSTAVDVSCNAGTNGSATVNVTGGTGAYTYSWAPSGGTAATATGLSAGTYTVTVTDANSCSATTNVVVNEPAALTATASKTDVSCNGGANGSATVSVTGGTGAYTYLWAPTGGIGATANGLTAGNYTVTVTDANSCQTMASVLIEEPALLTATISKTDVLCNQANNGTATVTAAGGTGTYTYSWSPSGGTAATATDLSPDTYTVTITDVNGCFITQTVQITEPAPLSATDSQTDVSCNGGANGTASVTATGGTGAYTYLWAPSGGNAATATGLSAGTYTVTVTDANSCSIVNTITITEPSALTATASKTDVTCNGGANGSATVSVTGGTGAYTYSWAPAGGTAATATGLAAGTYTVTITDANFCQTTETVTIDEPTILTASITKTDVSCNQANNGTATVTAAGGTGAYTYSWSPSGGTAATAAGLAPDTYTVTVTDANGCFITQTVQITEPAALSASDSQTNVSCKGGNDGTATVTAAGGTGAYTYLWAPSGGTAATATGLSAGTYTVTVTDAKSCSITNTITITEPDALALTSTAVDVSCNAGTNGSATVNATGGTGAYTYSWAPSGGTAATATGLSAGTYTVTVTDANSCSATADVIVNEPAALAATASKTDVSCNGGANGSATVTATGGTGSYTYLWAPSGGTAATASGLTAGTYTVTVTDANFCQTTETVTIDEPTILTASITKTDVLCNQANNGTATVTAAGGTGAYTYSWSPSGGTAATAAGLAPDTYTVTVTDANGCFITQTVQITEPAALSASDSQTNVSCKGGNDGTATVTAAGGTGAYTYSWAPAGGTAATATGLSAGIYMVTVTDANSCSVTNTITITEPDALALTTTSTDVSCNAGANGSATVNVTGGTGAYTYSWSPSGGTAATATGLSAGTYTVTVTDANGCFATETIHITEPALLSATYTQTNVSCHGGNDGAASVIATGGNGAYTYLWAPAGGTAATATGLSAGTYTVTITDANSCSTVNTITITEPDALALTATVTEISCYNGNNGSASISAAGGSGSYSYSWAPSGGTSAIATGLSAGTYTVTVTDANSCSATINVVITQPANPVDLTTSAVSGITVNGASLSGSASSDGINNDKGECLTEVGFVYAMHANPTTADTKINAANTLGAFTNSLSGLRGNRTYYVRTYAINSNGFVNYGNEVSFTTQKYTLTITAAAGHTKVYGTADPVFNFTSLGLANGDTASIITGLLSRDAGENVGKYDIKLGTINAGADYIIDFTGAEFEITKADQTITWNQTLEFGCSDSNSLVLTAAADSGLPVSYTSANPALAAISGTTLSISGSGSTTITAVQNGDQNHNAAATVIKTIEISQSGLVVQQWANVLFFDNKSNNYVAWQWYKNGVAVSGATRQYYSELQPLNGTYHVIAKDKNGNSIKSCPIEATGTVFTKKIKIYPNPVKPGSEFTLECDFSESQLSGSEVTIFDITGKLVQTISNVTSKNQIIAPSQSALYVIVLKLANGQIKTINLLVK